MMKLKTFTSLIKSGQLLLLLRLKGLSAAGFERNLAINLIPGDKYHAFVGYKS